jgi:hypothetical protein
MKILHYVNIIDARIDEWFLNDYGVDTIIFDEGMVSMNWFNSLAIGGVKVCVKDEDYLTAIELIKKRSNGEFIEDNEKEICCPYCGSYDTIFEEYSRIFRFIFLLIFPLPIPVFRNKRFCKNCNGNWPTENTRKWVYGLKNALIWGFSIAAIATLTYLYIDLTTVQNNPFL